MSTFYFLMQLMWLYNGVQDPKKRILHISSLTNRLFCLNILLFKAYINISEVLFADIL